MKTLSILLLLAGLAHGQTTTYCAHGKKECVMGHEAAPKAKVDATCKQNERPYAVLNPGKDWEYGCEDKVQKYDPSIITYTLAEANAEARRLEFVQSVAPKAKVDAQTTTQPTVTSIPISAWPSEPHQSNMDAPIENAQGIPCEPGFPPKCPEPGLIADPTREELDRAKVDAIPAQQNTVIGDTCGMMDKPPCHDTVSEGGPSGFSAPVPAFRAMVTPSVTPSSTHQVTLSGCTSSGGQVTGFIFLRGTVSGGPYTQLTPGTAATCNYVDTQSLIEGTTYFYVAEAIGPGGSSGYSNQVAAPIPFLPPGVPTNLQAAPQ